MRFQFSLLRLMIAVTVFAIVSGLTTYWFKTTMGDRFFTQEPGVIFPFLIAGSIAGIVLVTKKISWPTILMSVCLCFSLLLFSVVCVFTAVLIPGLWGIMLGVLLGLIPAAPFAVYAFHWMNKEVEEKDLSE